jgi:FkbM family methyltransferase
MLHEKARSARRGWLRRRQRTLEHRRRVQFYRQFAAPGELCFDIGANVGNRTEVLLAIPARVVAVEPLSACNSVLEQRWGKLPRFELVKAALGREPSEADILTTSAGSALASMSTEWIDRVRVSGRFQCDWDTKERVAVTTLDSLIRRYGEPSFCKIDVEGYEREVLEGLTTPIRALSIEFAGEYLDATEQCIARLLTLGEYEFNFSLGESLLLAEARWRPPDQLLASLQAGTRDDWFLWGDVYARLNLGGPRSNGR